MMPPQRPIDEFVEFVSTESGLTNQIADRLGLLHPWTRRLVRVALLAIVTWVPLLLLASLSGHLSGRTVAITLLRDPEVNCRFLLALPLLELAEVILAISLSAQVKQLLHSGIIPQSRQDQFAGIRTSVRRMHQSPITEIALLAIALVSSIVIRSCLISEGGSSWERQGNTITPAGWWHLLISLPVLYFFLLRAFWMFALWGWFLFQVSKMELELTATHPDHAGGLGFLGWGLASFSPMALAFSTVVSSGFAFEIYHRGESLESLKYHIIIYVILATCVLHLPVLPFAPQLSRSRFRGLLEFSNLVWRHDRAFDEKWIHQTPSKEPLLGSADVQSLADIATAYDHVNEMGFIPLDMKSVSTLAIASAVPMLPLIGTEIPIAEILAKLGELLV